MKLMPIGLLICALSLSACSWQTYTKDDGSTGLRRSAPIGAGVYYEDGTYSNNQRHNQYRPVRHVLAPAGNTAAEPPRTRWAPINPTGPNTQPQEPGERTLHPL